MKYDSSNDDDNDKVDIQGKVMQHTTAAVTSTRTQCASQPYIDIV